VRKPIFLAGVLGLAASSSVNGAVVTYFLNLHESASGQVTTANQFAIWVSVSQNDNAGLFAFGVDLKGQGEPGGPTTMTLVNRSPVGTFDVDENDANYDGGVYTKFIGFGTGRGASNSTGVVSGVQDLAKSDSSGQTPGDLIRLYGFGQVAHRLDDFRPPPAEGSLGPIPYKPINSGPGIDGGGAGGLNPYGVPPQTCGVLQMPAGSARIATGSWTGTAPSIDQLSVNTKASVWKLSELNNPKGTQSEIASLNFALRDITPAAAPAVSLTATVPGGGTCGPTYSNMAVGGAVAVTGANGAYSSEVDQLLDPSSNAGYAPIQGIGNEAGSIYVMGKLQGTQADIAAVLAAFPAAVDASDSQYASLHAAYDGQFGGGGFNALWKFSNYTGAKIFTWDFSAIRAGVTMDQLAAVPEPASLSLLGVACAALWRRRRR